MKTKILPSILSISVIAFLIISPDRYLPIALDGIKIFGVNVMPALLPFFFFTGLLSNLGAGEIFGKMLSCPCKKLYNTSGIGGYVFLTGILSGYPISAKVISDLVKDRKLELSDAKTIMTYTSTSGPLFIIGTVGSIMLGNKTYGYIILVCHYLSAILNGLIYRNKSKDNRINSLLNPKSTDNILSESAYSAVISVFIAGAYVTIFYTIAHMLTDIGVVKAISSLFSIIFDNDISSGIAFGLVEMTGGCIALSKTTSEFTLPAICAIISFGGLSVTLQSMTFLEKVKIKPLYYLLSKTTQSIIAFFVTYIATIIFL